MLAALTFALLVATPATWRDSLALLEARRDELVSAVGQAQDDLRARAGKDRPDLLPRIDPSPPSPRRAGVGVVPKVVADEPAGPVEPVRTWYSLGWLRSELDDALGMARDLRLAATESPKDSLDDAVTRLAAARDRLSLLESHISHHRLWQQDIHERPEHYAQLAGAAQDLQRAREALDRGDAPGAAAIRARVAASLAPMHVPAGISLTQGADGSHVVHLRVLTDITDEALLTAFADGARREWCESAGARARRFTLDLQLQRVTLDPLPKDAPPPDLERQLARFPPSAFVLTTGGDALHVASGRAIVLGPDPVAPRPLAHEIGHLLGFQDAYLRVFEGDLASPDGVTIIEWGGIADDLMGSSGRGTVTSEMIDRLLNVLEAAAPAR